MESISPMFTIVFFPEINAKKLKIPAHASLVLRDSVTLRDNYKNTWHVEVRKIDGHLYLQDGWTKFVVDNYVTTMDVLAFHYSGPGLLDVYISGTDGDIKEGVGYHKIDHPKEHQNIETDESEDDDMYERMYFGKNKKLLNYNSVKVKGKMGKEVRKYQYDTDEYGTDYDFTHDGGQGYWNGERDDVSEERVEYELDYPKKDKGKEVTKELRNSKNDNNASDMRKPYHKKRSIDCLSQGILRPGMASMPKSSDLMKITKPLYINELNKGKGILNKISRDEEENDSADESIELETQSNKKGKGLSNEPRAYARTYTAAAGSKRRNINDNLRRNKFITFTPVPMPMIPSFSTKMQTGNRGQGILDESSDKDSDSNYRSYDSYEEISEEEFESGIKGLENEKKLKSKSRDVKASKSITSIKRVRVDYLGKKLFESAKIPRPECKYFVTTPKPRRMNELYIPKDILMDENLWLPKKIKLVDPRGDTYTSWLVVWTDGRTFYKGGWNRLSRRNHLTKNDFCICEFGEGDYAGYLFISFLRRCIDN